MSEEGRIRYKDNIQSYTSDNIPTYQAGDRAGQQYDCADLTTQMSMDSMESATSQSYGIENFSKANGNDLSTVQDIHSSDFADDTSGNITFYRNPDGSIDNNFNSQNVETGTIGVFSNHIITVTEDRSDVTDPIKTLQGHQTRNSSIDPIPDQEDLDSYQGDFIGWAEVGSGSTTPKVSLGNTNVQISESLKNK